MELIHLSMLDSLEVICIIRRIDLGGEEVWLLRCSCAGVFAGSKRELFGVEDVRARCMLHSPFCLNIMQHIL